VEPIFPGEWLAQTTPWNVSQISSPRAWSVTRGYGVKLLVIDSGISTHEDLSWTARTRCIGTSDDDVFGHGTFVSGVIKATNNTIGVVGNASDVSLYVVKVGDSAPDPAATACAVEYGRNQGVFVMTMSLSLNNYENLNAQIAGAYNEGRLLVAAAGNTNGGAVTYPATLNEVIAVGATTSSNARASFSAIGSKVELAAPGSQVHSTTKTSGSVCINSAKYGYCDGTSFAAPAVAAVAALVKSYNWWFSNVDVRNQMDLSATDLGASGRDTSFGYGLVDAGFATLGYKVTTETRSYSCYYERGGHIWESRETWGRDTTRYIDGSVVVGDPYYIGTEEIDTGPTAGIGPMSCDYYPGYW
jgi:hypothetical protein